MTDLNIIQFLWVVERGRCVTLTTSPPPLNQLYRQCGIFNLSQTYWPPRHVTEMGLLQLLLFACKYNLLLANYKVNSSKNKENTKD
jgi:hypothetical protein